MAACYLEARGGAVYVFPPTATLFSVLFFRLDCFGLPLGVLVVFRFLVDGHNPQDVATSFAWGGLDRYQGTKLGCVDAGMHFKDRRWKSGITNIEALVIFLAFGGSSSEGDVVSPI
jgi:hypothetical protein